MLPLRFPAIWIVGGWVLVLAAVYFSVMPSPQLHIGSYDKLMHVVTYLALTLWFVGMYQRSRYAVVGFSMLLLGLVLELVQGRVGRSPEFGDLLADASGIAIALILGWSLVGGWCLWVESLIARDR
ncbi:MAG: VanZ family protein [Gammaproteobacteria bacterium]